MHSSRILDSNFADGGMLTGSSPVQYPKALYPIVVTVRGRMIETIWRAVKKHISGMEVNDALERSTRVRLGRSPKYMRSSSLRGPDITSSLTCSP